MLCWWDFPLSTCRPHGKRKNELHPVSLYAHPDIFGEQATSHHRAHGAADRYALSDVVIRPLRGIGQVVAATFDRVLQHERIVHEERDSEKLP